MNVFSRRDSRPPSSTMPPDRNYFIPTRNRGRFSAFILGLIFLFCGASIVSAQEASIDEVVLTNSSRFVLLYFRLSNVFSPEVEKAVENGIPATFTFEIELARARSGWLDKGLVTHRFVHTMIYDNLKEEYRIMRGDYAGRTHAVKSLAEAKQAMATVNGFPVIELEALEPGADYVVRARAFSERNKLPTYFRYLVPFWRSWEFETAWRQVEFRY